MKRPRHSQNPETVASCLSTILSNGLMVLLLLLGGSACSSENPDEAAKASSQESFPNIIYVLADDMGIGDLSVYNKDSKIPTPHLDQLASGGMMFTDAHTSSSVCTPTRYGILTGRYNWRPPLKHSVLGGKSTALIPSEQTTVASLLQKQGYHTAFIGKWHLGWDWAIPDTAEFTDRSRPQHFESIDYSKPITNGPNDNGFDYAYGFIASLDMAPYVYVENGTATMAPDTVTESKTAFGWWRKGPTSADFVHEQVTPNLFERSIRHIEEQAKTDNPFFLYLPLPSPHTPILPTPEWQGKSGLNPYADFVMMVDDYMGQLMETLKTAGIQENTLILFTSDNGCSPAADIEGMEAKGHFPGLIYRGHKADIFEAGHRVPFIVSWPAVVPKGQTNNQLICTTDLLATAAEITGYNLASNEGEDSYSMLPIFRGKPEDFQRTSVIHHSIEGRFAIRKGDWKLNFCPGSGGWSTPNRKTPGFDSLPPYQLYNLANDPGETENLYGQHAEITEDLEYV